MARTNPTARPIPRDSLASSMVSATASTPFSPKPSPSPSESSSDGSATSISSVPQNPCPPRANACAASPACGGLNPPNISPNPPPGIRGSGRHLNYAEMGALRGLLFLDKERNGAIGTFYNPPTP
ncbi:uncharacterized protein SCHCODRAFT_02682823 [Schizophyllum commune H4-8]|nr:uncharacterized protein SCHCODRAFT_02682823 [Schizophyllum commune H4-8]KAI5899882.1 hypothetical protein SCHCODRAFT_02682823 [Schizophyllum commune H4-8]